MISITESVAVIAVVVVIIGYEGGLRVLRVYIGIIMIWIRVILTMTTRARSTAVPLSAAIGVIVVVEVTHNERDL